MSLTQDIKGNVSKQLLVLLGKKNVYELPKIKAVVVNVWVWTYLSKSWTSIDDVVANIAAITCSAPVIHKAKLAVSNFKLRKWMQCWVRVTLRWKKMYWFLEKIIKVVLPRVRDFRWIKKKSFDKLWNYSFWLSDVTVFPELHIEDINKTHWIQITIVIDSDSKENSFELLKLVWLPFQK